VKSQNPKKKNLGLRDKNLRIVSTIGLRDEDALI
jgi:hypothetical protein